MDWIVSLVAVLVSMVTVIVSYMINKATIKSNEYVMQKSNMLAIDKEMWNKFFDNCEELVQITDSEIFIKFINDIIILKNQNMQDDKYVNSLNDIKVKVKQHAFNIVTYYDIFNSANCDELRASTNEYVAHVVKVLDYVQAFYFGQEFNERIVSKLHNFIDEFQVIHADYEKLLQSKIVEIKKNIYC